MNPRNRHVAMWAAAVATLLLLIAGCVTKVPLSDVDNATVDPKLVGLWEAPHDKGEDLELLAIVPFDKHAYLLTDCKYQKTGDEITPKGQVIFRAWLTQIAGQDFYTVDIRTPHSILAHDNGDLSNGDPPYIVGTWKLADDNLALTTLNTNDNNPSAAAIKAAATTAELQKLVAAHLTEKDFLKAFITYKKVPADRTKDALAILEKFENHD